MVVFDVYDNKKVDELREKWMQDAAIRKICSSIFPIKACLSDETILPNSYTLYAEYTYIGCRDGMFFAFINDEKRTVSQAKRLGSLTAIHRCNIPLLKQRIEASLQKEKIETPPTAMEIAFQQAKRK